MNMPEAPATQTENATSCSAVPANSFRFTWRAILDFVKCPRILWHRCQEMFAGNSIPEKLPPDFLLSGGDRPPGLLKEIPPVIYFPGDNLDPASDLISGITSMRPRPRNTLVCIETLRLTSSDHRFEGVVRLHSYNDTPVAGLSPLDTVPPEEQKTVLKFCLWLMEENGRTCHTGVMQDPLTGLSHLESFSAGEMAAFRSLPPRIVSMMQAPLPPAAEKCCERCSGCQFLERCAPAGLTPGIPGLENMSPEERRLYIKNDYEKYPLFICTQGSRVSVSDKCLIVRREAFPDIKKPLSEISMLVAVGGISISTPCLKVTAENGIPVILTSLTGKCYAISAGTDSGYKNATALKYQVTVSQNAEKALEISRALIKTKIRNQSELIRRISRDGQTTEIKNCLISLNWLCKLSSTAENTAKLMGIEGEAASLYFAALSLKISETGTELIMNGRSHRPPGDHLNALLSFGYALLLNNVITAVRAYGLSEWLGFLHSERSGKPALALDLMEEFRAPVVDALIISIVRNRLFTVADFTEEYNDRNEKICLLNESSRKKFITLFQRRLDTFCTHRYSGKRLSWREIIYQQAGILLKTLKGELNSYIGMEY